jgi:hypothetical protein
MSAAAAPPAMNQVKVTYGDSALRFKLPPSATMIELVDMLAEAGRGHGSPIRVEVRLSRRVSAAR